MNYFKELIEHVVSRLPISPTEIKSPRRQPAAAGAGSDNPSAPLNDLQAYLTFWDPAASTVYSSGSFGRLANTIINGSVSFFLTFTFFRS